MNLSLADLREPKLQLEIQTTFIRLPAKQKFMLEKEQQLKLEQRQVLEFEKGSISYA